jgi:hypothetical protein
VQRLVEQLRARLDESLIIFQWCLQIKPIILHYSKI